VKVYAICKPNGDLFRNQSFATQQEAEADMQLTLEGQAELRKAMNWPALNIALHIVQLDLADYEAALSKMDDELVKALDALEDKP